MRAAAMTTTTTTTATTATTATARSSRRASVARARRSDPRRGAIPSSHRGSWARSIVVAPTRATETSTSVSAASATLAEEDEEGDDDDDKFDALPDAEDEIPAKVATFLKRDGRHATFAAKKSGSVEIVEAPGARSLRQYMSLPASQYSTLDGEKVERIGDDVFKCTLGTLDFLGFEVRSIHWFPYDRVGVVNADP